MKIGIDIRSAGGNKTGKGWLTYHIVKNLLNLDHDNQYILYTQDGISAFANYKNAEMRIVKSKGIFWHRNMIKDAKREELDVFIAPTSYIIPSFLPKAIKSIIFIHDLVAFLFPNNHNKKAVIIERLLLKRALKKATMVMTISENTKRDIMSFFKYPEDKITIAYCSAGENFKPLNKEELEPFAKETSLPKNFFLAVGTLEPRKNYINLIEAFDVFSKKYKDFHLVIVGGQGWKYEEIYEKVKKLYLQKKVHFIGYVSEKSLVKLYNLAKALVFPSIYEGFGIPPLEAMKCGCPVIASYTSSIPEVVGDAGILINPGEPMEIAGAMAKIINNQNLCAELKNKSLLQSKKFSWESSAKKLMNVINRI